MCRLRHINDPVLSSLKMEGIRLLFLICMVSMLDLTRLEFCERGNDELFTEETAVTFSLASVNPGFVSWKGKLVCL
jgi:hypothetical protein